MFEKWEGLLLSTIMKKLSLAKLKTGVAKNEAIVSDEFEVVVCVHFI
jgi:hypothetical protein